MPVDSQFQTAGRNIGNWDRCRLCGYPRMLHGSGGSCGYNVSKVTGFLTMLVIAGGVLSAASWALVSNPAASAGSLAAFAFLVTVVMVVVCAKAFAFRAEHHGKRSCFSARF